MRAGRLYCLRRVPYAQGLSLQAALWRAVRRGSSPPVLLALEHAPACVTLGRRADAAHVLASAELLRARGVEVHRVARGGEATYHGPGQAVLYPIVPLAPARRAACSIAGGGGGAGRGRDALAIGVRRYVEHLEDVMVAAAQRRGVAARGRVPGRTGVWVGGCSSGEQNTGRKLGAVGVQLKERVTTHGLALNVDMDLSAFRELIVPCGLPGGEATSLAREMAAAGGDGQRPSVEAVLREMASDLAERLGLRMEERPAEQLLEELGALQPELNGGVV